MALKYDLTSGDVRKQLIRFATPQIFSNLIQALYNATDMFFVGRFGGTVALSSVAVGGPVINILIFTITGLSIGVTIVIASHMGGGENSEKLTKACANTAITLYLMIAAVVTVLGSLLTPAITRIMNCPPEASAGAISYLRTIFIGIVFMFGYNLISAFQNGFGDSRTPLVFVSIACFINVILDYILIGPLHMGPFGAAFATVTAQAISFILGIIYFRRKKHIITFDPREFKIDKAELKLIVHMGLPAAIQSALNTVSSATMTGIANGFGLAVSAAYGIVLKIESFSILPANAIGMSVSPFSSQNVGAGKPERALKGLWTGIRLSQIITLIICATVFTFSAQLASIFDKNPEVIANASVYMKYNVVCFILLASVMPLIGFIRGTGNSIFTLFSAIICQYVLRIPLAFILSRKFGFNGIAFASMFNPIASNAIYLYAVLSGRWKNSKVMRRVEELRKDRQ